MRTLEIEDGAAERRKLASSNVLRSLGRRLAPATVAALVVIGSCSDATGPGPLTCTLPTEALPEASLLGATMVAESQRVVGNMPQNSKRDAVSSSLTKLSQSLSGGGCATTELASAHAAVAGYQLTIQASVSAQADLEAVRLMVDAAQRFVDGLR